MVVISVNSVEFNEKSSLRSRDAGALIYQVVF